MDADVMAAESERPRGIREFQHLAGNALAGRAHRTC
jgi:hypothetical protein